MLHSPAYSVRWRFSAHEWNGKSETSVVAVVDDIDVFVVVVVSNARWKCTIIVSGKKTADSQRQQTFNGNIRQITARSQCKTIYWVEVEANMWIANESKFIMNFSNFHSPSLIWFRATHKKSNRLELMAETREKPCIVPEFSHRAHLRSDAPACVYANRSAHNVI